MEEEIIDLSSASDEADIPAAANTPSLTPIKVFEGGRESAEPSSLNLVHSLN